jgi:hypothetical protein
MQSPKRYLSPLICCCAALLACDGTGSDDRPGGDSTTQAGAAATPLTVITGAATDIDAYHARLGLQVVPGADGVTECGVCWGPSVTDFVTQTGLLWEQRCMRQVPCLGNAYFTNDGYMSQREYAAGEKYRYKAYAIDGTGRVTYGDDKTFTVPWLSTARCGGALGFSEVRLASTSLSKTGPLLPIEAIVCNPTPTIAEGFFLQARIEQGTTVAQVGGTLTNCWIGGNVRPGLCPTHFDANGHGNAVVPGPATLAVELCQPPLTVVSTYRTAITVEP